MPKICTLFCLVLIIHSVHFNLLCVLIFFKPHTNKPMHSKINMGRAGSIGRALASRSNGLLDQRFESRPEHKKNV